MADKVVQKLSEPKTTTTNSIEGSGSSTIVQRKCDSCDKEEKLQMKEGDELLQNDLEVQRKPIFESNDEQSQVNVQTKSKSTPVVQLKCAACEQEEKLQMKEDEEFSEENISVQTKSMDTQSDSLSDFESQLDSSKGGGSSLPSDIQSSMGSEFGADFSNVKIHTGSEAVQMSNNIGAQAFTHGSNIYFNEGKYNTNSNSGKHLLAHELTHTIQQGSIGPLAKPKESNIQKKPIGEQVQDKLRASNTTVATEVPIPGAAPRGIAKGGGNVGFDRMGFADLFLADTIPGIRGIPVDDITEGTDSGKKKYVYANISQSDLAKVGGAKTPSPSLTGGTGKYARFIADAQTSTHYSGHNNISGNFPSSIKIGEIKGKGVSVDNPLFAPQQLAMYKKGLSKFIASAKRDFGQQVTNPSFSELTGLNIPPGLDYDDFNNQYDHQNSGFIKTRNKRVWLAEIGGTGVYLWARLPDPFNIPLNVKKEEHLAISKLRANVLEQFNKIKQNKPSGKLGSKKELSESDKNKEGKNKENIKNSDNQLKVNNTSENNLVQRQTDWKTARTNFNSSLKTWKKNHGKKFLKNDQVEKYLEEKVEFDKKLKKRETGKSKFNEHTKAYKKIDFWVSPKGLVIGNLRLLLGEKFDLLTEKIEGLKGRTKQVKAKAKGLSSPKFSKGWMAKIVKLLLAGFKIGFEEFIEYSFQVFAGCISGVIEKFEEEMRQKIVEGLVDEEMEQALNELKEQLESLIARIQEEYEAELLIFEDLLEKMKDAAFYGGIITTAVNLIRLGVQIVSCFTPPALGCLWGLVANIGIEVGLNLVVGTQWFEDEFMKPLVKDLMGGFLKNSLLKFLNKVFESVGLGSYVEGVVACKLSEGSMGSLRYSPGKGILIPPDMYRPHAKKWEANNKSALMNEVVTSSGGSANQQDIEKLLEVVNKKKMTSVEFTKVIKDSKTSENSFDFKTISGQIPDLEGSGDEGEAVRVIDGETSPMKDDGVGSGKAGTITVQKASMEHTKGSRPTISLLCISNDGENVIITNIKTKVINRYYFDSTKNRRLSSESGASHMQIIYQITKKSGYVVPFIGTSGVLPYNKTIKGYVKF